MRCAQITANSVAIKGEMHQQHLGPEEKADLRHEQREIESPQGPLPPPSIRAAARFSRASQRQNHRHQRRSGGDHRRNSGQGRDVTRMLLPDAKRPALRQKIRIAPAMREGPCRDGHRASASARTPAAQTDQRRATPETAHRRATPDTARQPGAMDRTNGDLASAATGRSRRRTMAELQRCGGRSRVIHAQIIAGEPARRHHRERRRNCRGRGSAPSRHWPARRRARHRSEDGFWR